MSYHRPLLLAAAIAASLSFLAPAFAQDAPPDAEIVAEATVPASKIAARYAELAGSPEAAATLVQQLRSGGDFTVAEQVTTTVTNPDGTTTTTTSTVERTIANPNGPMGYGEVNITLALADKLVAAGEATSLQAALTGTTTTVTNPDGTTTTTTSGGILAMRGDGMGWGQIARELGFKLGAVMGQGKADAGAAPAEKAARAEAKPERVAKLDRPTRPDKAERPQRPERPERPQKPERGGR
jgi:hypothetical protein